MTYLVVSGSFWYLAIYGVYRSRRNALRHVRGKHGLSALRVLAVRTLKRSKA